jgi:hypothetical protein
MIQFVTGPTRLTQPFRETSLGEMFSQSGRTEALSAPKVEF